MNIRKISAIAMVVMVSAVLWQSYSDHPGESSADAMAPVAGSAGDRPASTQPTTLQSYLSSYIVDKNQQIPLKATGLLESPTAPQPLLKDDSATSLVNRGTADYFRFLQTEFHAGATLQANTEAIHQHLLSSLPKDEAEKLFALYQKFVDFEFSVGDKAKDWKMPETPGETLALIGKMQKLQQQHFGEENADLLFGGELKTMEYNARRAGIFNDTDAPGAEKEAMLKKLATDMFGPEGATLDEKKNPYNLFEEKLLVYKNDLDKMEPLEREKMIKGFREKYLPASANSP